MKSHSKETVLHDKVTDSKRLRLTTAITTDVWELWMVLLFFFFVFLEIIGTVAHLAQNIFIFFFTSFVMRNV